MEYNEALKRLKVGDKIARTAWDGKYVLALSLENHTHLIKNEDGTFSEVKTTKPYMLVYNVENKTWGVNLTLSLEDKAANDWYIIKRESIC